MPTISRATAVLLVFAFAAPVAGAQDPAAPAAPTPTVTKITADIGYVNVSGNTRVTTTNIGEKLTQSRGRFAWEQGVSLVYSQQSDSVVSNYFRTHFRGDFKIDRLLALFAGVAFDRNVFAGIERRFEEQLGITARLIGSPSDTVRIEGGGTFTQQVGTDGTLQDFPSARGALNWRHGFTPATYFTQTVEFIPNLKETEDWRVNTESALVAPLSSRLALKLAYVIRFDNLPQPGFTDTDRLFTSGLQITF